MKALSNTELDALLAHADSHWLRTAILIGYRHGMRAQEITGLLRADVDLKHRTITVRRLKHSLTTKQPLTREECAALAQQFQLVESEFVFPSERGQHMAYITLWRHFRHAAELAGLPADKCGHIHGLKHKLGYDLVRANVTLPVIKQALGHKSLNATQFYVQVTDEDCGKIVQEALR